jgi:histidinol-phosphate aminotransferase
VNREPIRLHLNENTAGCSPAVLEALRALDRSTAGFYPDYDAAREAVAGYLDVPVDHLLLTNGLDEGILAVTMAAFRDRTAGIPEVLSVTPTFDMYDLYAKALGGRMAAVPLGDDLTLSVEAVAAAVTPRTRLVIVTNPHNPSGTSVPADDLRRLARRVAPALLLVDEAYAEFAGESVIDRDILSTSPNLVVGRTFSKAFGLAGLRAGAVVGHPATLEPMRQAVSPYNLNAWAAAAIPAAVGDRSYRDWYVAQATESRALLGEACARLGLRTWPSAANFLLIRLGERAPEIVAALAAHGVLVRDRSREPGCEQCIRMTAGLVEDTRRAIAALEEAVCAARQ